jgi:hypothetical protein
MSALTLIPISHTGKLRLGKQAAHTYIGCLTPNVFPDERLLGWEWGGLMTEGKERPLKGEEDRSMLYTYDDRVMKPPNTV